MREQDNLGLIGALHRHYGMAVSQGFSGKELPGLSSRLLTMIAPISREVANVQACPDDLKYQEALIDILTNNLIFTYGMATYIGLDIDAVLAHAVARLLHGETPDFASFARAVPVTL